MTSLGLALRLLEEGKRIEIEVAGMSMAPLLRRGDRIVIARAAESDLQKHDLAVVRTDGRLLAHRVVSVAPLVTRGDDAPADDPPWPANSVVGKVVAIRYDGHLFKLRGFEGVLRSSWSASSVGRRLRGLFR